MTLAPIAALETVATAFVDAFNRRDAEGLIAVCEPEVVYQPSALVGGRRIYHGHAGLRRWILELDAAMVQHRAQVREVRVTGERTFVVLSEVLLDGEPITPSAMVGRIGESGLIVDGHSYLSDERMLVTLGPVPPR
jgi:hypothetical protein